MNIPYSIFYTHADYDDFLIWFIEKMVFMYFDILHYKNYT